MYWLLVSPGLSEISPDAPGRIAYTGRGLAPGYPELTYRRPWLAKGVGTTFTVMPPSSQSGVPSSPYERTLFRLVVTISVRRSFSHTKGVDQLSFSGRGVRHSSTPVRVSYAA